MPARKKTRASSPYRPDMFVMGEPCVKCGGRLRYKVQYRCRTCWQRYITNEDSRGEKAKRRRAIEEHANKKPDDYWGDE